MPDSDKERDIIDANFEGIEDSMPSNWKPPPPPQKRRTSVITIVVLICLAGAIVYVLSGGLERTAQQTDPWPPGFSELFDCTSTASLDGTKELELYENQVAVSYDKLVKKNGKYQKTVGSWSFNPTTDRYIISFNDAASTYSIVKPEGAGLCMLIVGEIGAADLRKSWFAGTSNEGPDDAPPEAEINTP